MQLEMSRVFFMPSISDRFAVTHVFDKQLRTECL